MNPIISSLIDGAKVSTKIFIVTAIFSLIIGLILALISKKKLINKLINLYTLFFRGTPLMMQLILIMYGLPQLGIYIDRMLVAYIGFIVNYSAYFVEIFKSGINSIDADQIEAAKVFGANEIEVARYIIIPQAVKLQLPVISNELITLIKDTALVSVIAINDILRVVKELVANNFSLTPFVFSTVFYLLVTFIIVFTLRIIERRVF